jgi:hypothetical protein
MATRDWAPPEWLPGPTVHCGAYSIVCHPSPRLCVVREFDADGRELYRTYMPNDHTACWPSMFVELCGPETWADDDAREHWFESSTAETT